jgi:hypothetical protein
MPVQDTISCRIVQNKTILKGSDDGALQSGVLSFWTLSIAWYSKEHTTFRRPDLSSSSGVGNRIGAPFLTSEDEDRSGIRNVMRFLRYQTTDKVQKLSSPDYNTSLIC